ncbi:hypothetical protein P4O66_004988 [Electrophorus voltai]|uniref:Chemokine interleukin-8-like domain-containing protein n=1 Tax=Electrophorus voltai TaxID=2609070 RepID=A0AAD9A087_9TELE|nr:hypothetical protein P4O66_004988 [Electrophorus voltai]
MMNLHHSIVFLASCFYWSTAASWDPTCCLKKLNGNIPKRRIVRYTIQTAGPCPFEAIIFQTKCGRKLCYGLNMDKAMEVKNIIDEKRQKAVSSAEVSPNCKRSPGKRKRRRQQKGKPKKQ